MKTALHLAALLALAAPGAHAADFAHYSARDLGSLGFRGVFVAAVNNLGQVVGQSERPQNVDAPHAFATGPGIVGMIDLCPGESQSCAATGLNDAGLVTGWLESGGAFTVNVDGSGFTRLSSNLDLNGVNASGRLVGEHLVRASGATRAIIEGGVGLPPHDLGSLTGPDGSSQGNAINAAGAVVGCSNVASGAQHAFVLARPHGRMRDLGTLGGTNSCANAISDNGIVVGESDTAGGATHAFFAAPSSHALVDMGSLGGHYTEADAVNAAGLAVGLSIVGNAFDTRAFVYDTGLRQIADLNTLVDDLPAGVTLSEATAINALGQIGAASDDGRAWLLTPVARRR